MIIYLPLQARLNRMLDYSLPCHRLEIATERYNNNVPAKFTQQGGSILSTPPIFALSGWGRFPRDTSLCLLASNIPYWWCTCKANQIQARGSDLLTRLKYYTPDLHIISTEFLRPKHGSLFQKCPQWQGAMKGAYMYIMPVIGDTN